MFDRNRKKIEHSNTHVQTIADTNSYLIIKKEVELFTFVTRDMRIRFDHVYADAEPKIQSKYCGFGIASARGCSQKFQRNGNSIKVRSLTS